MTTLASSSRIEEIDVLRGFTLLGIAFVHFVEQYYAGPLPQSVMEAKSSGIADTIVEGFVSIFIMGKFFMIFSFLFGLSFYLQLSKNDDGNSFYVRFLWRLLLLFVIGFIHHVHYRGDILTIYAVLGVGLLILSHLPDNWLLGVSVLLILDLPLIAYKVYNLFAASGNGDLFNVDQTIVQHYYDTFKSGSYTDFLKANFYEFSGKMEFQVLSGRLFITLGLFLLGVYIGRRGMLAQAGMYLAQFKRGTRISLWVLLGCIVFSVILFGGSALLKVDLGQGLMFLIGGIVYDVFNAALALLYVCVVINLFHKTRWQKRLMFFYPVGRMGLSIYLLQTIFGVIIFTTIGFGLISEFGAVASLLIGLSVFAAQAIFAKFWFTRFQYGPVEWLWRSLTYLKMQPMRTKKGREPILVQ